MPWGETRRAVGGAIVCTGALAVLGFVVVLGGWSPADWVTGDHLSIVTGVWSGGCCLVVAACSGGRMRWSWALLSATLWLYAVGDVLWLAFGGAEGAPPVLSVADALYLVGLVPAVVGLLLYPAARGLRGTVGPVLLDAAVLGTAVLLASQVLVFEEVVAGAGTPRDTFMLLVYPVTDVLLACLVVLLLLRSVGEARPDVVLVGLAFGAYAVADNGYAVSVVRGEGYAGTYVDLTYVAAPLLLATAALSTRLFDTSTRLLRRQVKGVWAPVLPDLAAVVVLAICLATWLEGTTAWVLASALLLLTGLRQVTTTAQSQQLRRELEDRVARRTTELDELGERHERLEQLKYSFVGAVSHELRTPLAAIRGSLEMLSDGDAGELPSSAHTVLAMAARGSERLSRLVSDIIDLERLESGAFSFAPAVHDVDEVLADAVASLVPLAEGVGVRLVLDPVQAQVCCDADQLTQVMVNLVGNALKFAPTGSTISVSGAVRGDSVEIAVADQGRGIPVDELDAVFERFHQVETTIDQNKGGAGLGLAITKHIVEAHGGRIWAESPEGDGATFRFTLPAAVPVAPAPFTGARSSAA